MPLPITVILAQPGLPDGGVLTTIVVTMFLYPVAFLASCVALLLFIYRRAYFSRLHLVNIVLTSLAAIFAFTRLRGIMNDGEHTWYSYLALAVLGLSFCCSILHFAFRFRTRASMNPPLLIIFALLLSCPALFAQQAAADRFSHTVMTVKGDLDKDGLADSATVTQDTSAEVVPYRLQVYFAQRGGGYKLAVSTEKAIEPKYPEGRGGFTTGSGFAEIAIEKGTLIIRNDLLRGNYQHQFRYQDGNFELIGFKVVSSDGQGTMTTVDFNLSTGQQHKKQERYDTDKVLSDTTRKIRIRPLPRLQDLVPLEGELY